MTSEEFSEFRDAAVRELTRFNQACADKFRIGSWPRWDYDLDRGTLTFSENGVPQVRASIQVVGSTSKPGGTWMWSWHNESLPVHVKTTMSKVREFGEAENIRELTEPVLPDDEYLGWGLTAVAAEMLEAEGAYRCPGSNGFVYVVFSSVEFVTDEEKTRDEPEQVKCSDHGTGYETFACEHLVSNPAQGWFSSEPNEDRRWPDAWCVVCDAYFREQNEWNDQNSSKMKVRLLCHLCYERIRSQATSTEARD